LSASGQQLKNFQLKRAKENFTPNSAHKLCNRVHTHGPEVKNKGRWSKSQFSFAFFVAECNPPSPHDKNAPEKSNQFDVGRNIGVCGIGWKRGQDTIWLLGTHNKAIFERTKSAIQPTQRAPMHTQKGKD